MADIDGTSIFRDAAFRVLVPTCPDGLRLPSDEAGDADNVVRRWIATLEPQNERSCCFYGMYFLLRVELTAHGICTRRIVILCLSSELSH